MTLLSDVVIETYRRAMSSMREEQDQLGASVSANATSLSIDGTVGSIQPSSIIQVDYELFLVMDVSGSTNPTVTVIPAYLDSVSTSHTAGAIVTVNPRFPAVDIIRAVNETLDDLSSPTNGLFQAKTVTLTYNPVLIGYDMTDVDTNVAVVPADLIDLIEVRVHEYGPFNKWPVVPLNQVRLNRNADTTDFPSGLGLEFMGGAYPGRPIRVLYKAVYSSTLSQPTDDVLGVTGLHTQAHDILSLGAAYRLMAWRELKRSFTEAQGEPRRAQEVPVGSSETAVKLIALQFQNRVDAERTRLDRMYKPTWGR